MDDPQTALPEAPIDVTSDPDGEAIAPAAFPIAPLWRRAAAVIIDYAIVSGFLFLVAVLTYSLASRIGPWGRLVGMATALLYFGVGGSRLTGGQTPGKRIMGIYVTNAQRQPLSVPRALARAFIVNLILLVNGWAIPASSGVVGTIRDVVVFVQTAIVFYGLAALAYLMIFNRATRQGPHDLITGSYVVRKAATEAVAPVTSLPRIHLYVLGGLAALILIPIGIMGGIMGGQRAMAVPVLNRSTSLGEDLLTDPRFFSAQISFSTTTRVMGAGGRATPVTDLRIQLWAKESCQQGNSFEACMTLSREIARLAFDKVENIEGLTGMRIFIMNKADLGFATVHKTFKAEYTIEDWKEQLADH